MAVQQVISRGQRHFAAQPLVQRRLDLADDEYPAGSGLLEKRRQELALFLQRHVLALAPAGSRGIGRARYLAMHEAAAQLASPAARHANDAGRLGQAQAMRERQDDGLRPAQLLDRLRRSDSLAGTLENLSIPTGRTRHKLSPSTQMKRNYFTNEVRME
jgi:hypothetical protein